MNIKNMLTIQDCLQSQVVGHVLHTIIADLEWSFLSEQELKTKKVKILFYQSFIILTEDQLSFLTLLRLQGYCGAVLVLASHTYPETLKKYRILRYGRAAHAGCDFPWQLADIMEKIAQLQPLHLSNLELLQKELKTPKLLQEKIQKLLQNIEKNNREYTVTIQQIIDILQEIRQQTPAVCHMVIEIADHSAQIQHHFHRLIEQLAQNNEPNSKLFEELRSVLQKWSDITISTAEGLGKLDFLA